MLFTNRQRPQSISINAEGQIVSEISETKFLGVIVDNKLSWHAHIKYIAQKISKSVSLLRMVKFTFPRKNLKTLYHTFIYPYFNYCNLIWGSANSTQLRPVILLQKKCIRIISKSNYYQHTDPLFKELNLMKLSHIYSYNCAKFIFLCYNNSNYNIFRQKLIQNNSVHRYETKSAHLLRKPFVRLEKFMKSFLNKGIDVWNSLPYDIKMVKSQVTFKIKVKKHILSL